ncbi:MAG: flavin reductase [Desulfobacteraceae bacterium]|jgi:multimeric flavodoxin WrbA|nr:MAG: flavin reductase [Desulfobacteraceae bacterium]
MFILGLQGSPRKAGNTNHLLETYLAAAAQRGAVTERIQVAQKDIRPCIGCTNCERKGFCSIRDDDMTKEVYGKLRRADVVVLATPIYFYNATAQLKTVIDRSQTLWARKYKLGLTDPGRPDRKGVLLAVGATKGKNLFEGMNLTAKYFFDAVGADFSTSLTYRHIEDIGDMEKNTAMIDDVNRAVAGLSPLLEREKILFVCRDNASRSQMAAVFTQYLAGAKIEALSAGISPAAKVDPVMEQVMAESGMDAAFRRPRLIDDVIAETPPDMVITMGCADDCPEIKGAQIEEWDLPDAAGRSEEEAMRYVRDEIEQRVKRLIGKF